MADVSIDVSQLRALAEDLRRHSRQTPAKLVPVVSRGALNIKREWQRSWAGLSHLPALASAVTYDTKVGVSSIEAEIGPDKGRPQGPLGNIAEFGSVKNAPHPGGAPALRNEEPRFLSAVEKIAGGLLG